MQKFSLFLMLLIVKTQSQSSQTDFAPGAASHNFHPSLAAIIAVLSCMVLFTFILLLYAKYCHQSSPDDARMPGMLTRSRSQYSGIDKTVIESLPFFKFSSLKGSRRGLECAVCLSKFEDIEILRLLPKCKHAFHINCVDKWLEKHSSCPLCRHKISTEDLAVLTYSNSLRFLRGHSSLRQDSNLDIFVQRGEDFDNGSSRYSARGSFRGTKEEGEVVPIQETCEEERLLHKFNHKIIVSDVVLKNRWSNVSSSDLLFLNSEMINVISNQRFSEADEYYNIEDSKIYENDKLLVQTNANISKNLDPKRSMSEIVVHPRFEEFSLGNSAQDSSSTMNLENCNVKEERLRRMWLPIARKTVQWLANRDTKSTNVQNRRQSFDV